MLDMRFIRENIAKVKASCDSRGAKVDQDALLGLDE